MAIGNAGERSGNLGMYCQSQEDLFWEDGHGLRPCSSNTWKAQEKISVAGEKGGPGDPEDLSSCHVGNPETELRLSPDNPPCCHGKF